MIPGVCNRGWAVSRVGVSLGELNSIEVSALVEPGAIAESGWPTLQVSDVKFLKVIDDSFDDAHIA